MRVPLFAIALLTVACLTAAPNCGGHGTRDTMLVSTDWLAAHLRDTNLVVLSIGEKTQYSEGHIRGARYFEYTDLRAPNGNGLTLELLPADQLAELFQKVGVSNTSRVILYASGAWTSQITRVYLTLDSLGLAAQTSILNGGYLNWKSEGKAISTEAPTPARGKLIPCVQDDIVTTAAYVNANLHHAGIAIIDARDLEYYTGARHGNGTRNGHIPGAANITYSSLFDEKGKLKSAEALAFTFQAAGIQPGDRVVSYCHIGQQASVIYFVARYLGYDARLYDGSWEDWSTHAEYPIATTPDK